MASAGKTSAAGLTASVLRSAEELEALQETWSGLEAQSPVSPWQQWDFLSRWWTHVGAFPTPRVTRELRIVLVSDGKVPRLLLPLQLSRPQRRGMRWLEPLGMLDDIHRPRFGIGALDREAYSCGLDALDSFRREWDGVRIDEKTPDDPEYRLLNELISGRRWKARSSPLHACPTLILDKTWPAYLAGRSQKLRKNLSSSRRRLQALGAVSLRCFQSPEELKQGFELLLDVTHRSWKATAGIGLGAAESYRALYRDFVQRMAGKDRARAYVLYCGERPVAATLAITQGTTYFSTHIAHDAGFDHCSPGTLLESMEMEALLTEGRFKVFDFLGAALSNKRRWTDTMEDTLRVMWLRPSLRSRLFDTLYFQLKPLARRLRHG